MKTYDFRAGEVILINKPIGWTSFQVVNKLKYSIKNHPSLQLNGERINPKIGHAGTLDPLATGLLIICTGKQTKNINMFQSQEKEYTGTFFIGATTPCYDLEKPADTFFPIEHISAEMIYATAKSFQGSIMQVPPIFSAIKIGGKRAYKIARAGKTAIMEARQIEISKFEITGIKLPEVDFKIVCSKGTYIRSIARDFGLALKSGAHLTVLCRTRIGESKLQDSQTIEEFIASVSSSRTA